MTDSQIQALQDIISASSVYAARKLIEDGYSEEEARKAIRESALSFYRKCAP